MAENESPVSEPGDLLNAALLTAFAGKSNESSAIDAVARIVGRAPRVFLRDDASPEAPSPIVDASGRDELPLPVGKGNYQHLGVIARGGMGTVIKSRDLDLGRDVALKVMQPEYVANAGVLQRFVEEAQIGAQLQHPGIVPVHELGMMADRRPYFAMKLVKGRTLSALLSARKDPGQDRRRFLAIFESVCQTIAYAHARGVIHRDLKPSNVMVGSFGEVHVVDWGLGKVLRSGGTADDHYLSEEDPEAGIETVRSAAGSRPGDSMDGVVLGTPANMPPEQARGEIELLDERTDVFALGGILAEILTGRPLYRGSRAKILIQAARGELGPIHAALQACTADRELVELCRDCLSSDPAERPANAGVVTDRLHAHLASADDRARQAQIEAAEARGKAMEERRARKLTVALAASVLGILALGGGGWLWSDHQRADRLRESTDRVDTALAEANLAFGKEQWSEAVAAARRTVALAEAAEGAEHLAAKARSAIAIEAAAGEALESARLVAENRELLQALESIRPSGRACAEGDRCRLAKFYPPNWSKTDGELEGILQRYGIAPLADPEETVVEAARARGMPIPIAAALHEWSRVRRELGDSEGAVRLEDLADLVDPDEDRVRLRAAIRKNDTESLKSYTAGAEELPVATLSLLGQALVRVGAIDDAVGLYRRGVRRWPGEYALHMDLARLLSHGLARGPAEAWRHYEAALALRPESVEAGYQLVVFLAHALDEHELALERCEDLIRMCPDDGKLYYFRGSIHGDLGEHQEAAADFRLSTELDPEFADAHCNLGEALKRQGRLEQAIPCFQEAIRLDPKNAVAHNGLGSVLAAFGDFERAARSFEKATELSPKYVGAWLNRGSIYNRQGQLDKASDCLDQAMRIDSEAEALVGPGGAPWSIHLHNFRGCLFFEQGDFERAAECFEHAIELDSEAPELHYNLGNTFLAREQFDEAIKCYEDELVLYPMSIQAHVNLGNALVGKGQVDDAILRFQQAIRLDQKFVLAHVNLANAYREAGRISDAINALRDALKLAPDMEGLQEDLERALEEQQAAEREDADG